MGDIDTQSPQIDQASTTSTTSSLDTSILFQPYKLGLITLSSRIVLAPLARRRSDTKHVPTDLVVEYYAQRASTPGTLLITESTYIASQSVGRFFNPGVWNDEQIEGWKKVRGDSLIIRSLSFGNRSMHPLAFPGSTSSP